jgi:hypothetical protein
MLCMQGEIIGSISLCRGMKASNELKGHYRSARG